MTRCQACGGRAQLPLCGRCADRLVKALTELQWLLVELETTKARQGRLSGGVGRSPEHPSPVDMGAVELGWRIHVELARTVRAVDPTVLVQRADVRTLAWWLRQHVHEVIVGSHGVDCLAGVERLVGFNGDGPIHDVINPPDRRFAGTCPDCGTPCHAKAADVYVGCGGCGLPIDVDKNREDTIRRHDRMPERILLRALDDLGEHVPRVTFYGWVTSGRLPSVGYLTDRGIAEVKAAARDPKVYSLARVRDLRRRDRVLA